MRTRREKSVVCLDTSSCRMSAVKCSAVQTAFTLHKKHCQCTHDSTRPRHIPSHSFSSDTNRFRAMRKKHLEPDNLDNLQFVQLWPPLGLTLVTSDFSLPYNSKRLAQFLDLTSHPLVLPHIEINSLHPACVSVSLASIVERKHQAAYRGSSGTVGSDLIVNRSILGLI